MERKAVKTSSQRQRLTVYGACGLLVVAGLIFRGMRGGPSQAAASAVSAAAAAPARRAQPAARELPAVVLDWSTSPQNDPFRIVAPTTRPSGARSAPTTAPAVDLTALVASARASVVVQAIIDGPTPVVLVNGRSYRVGQTINGFVLRRIDQKGVVVERSGVYLRIAQETDR